MGSRVEGQGQGSRIQVVDAALAGRALVPAWLSPSFLMGIGIGDPFGKRVPASAWLPPLPFPSQVVPSTPASCPQASCRCS